MHTYERTAATGDNDRKKRVYAMRRRALLVVAGFALVLSAAASADGGEKPVLANTAVAGTVVTDNGALVKGGAVAAASSAAGPSTSLTVQTLSGYSVIQSGAFPNPAGAQSYGSVACPTGTVAFGGGLVSNGYDLSFGVNSSYPTVAGGVATGWQGYMNNASPLSHTFSVYAVCAKKPANYAVVSASFSNLAGRQSGGGVTCPLTALGKVMQPFGGGAYGFSSSTGQNINSTYPTTSPRGWHVDMNNASPTDSSYTVYAVCGTKAGWTVVKGTAVANPALGEGIAAAYCPTGEVAVGGGVLSNTASTTTNLKSTYAAASTIWVDQENNRDSLDHTITPYAVCLLQ